jgi:hypothetical protein
MNAKELLVDFANYLFFVIVCLFFVFYFILGDRMDLLINILKSMTPLAIFGLAFLFKLKKLIKYIRPLENEEVEDNEVWYVTRMDVIKDRLIICFLPLVVLAIAFFDGDIDRVDILQSVFCFTYFIFFHWLMFRKDAESELRILNKNSKTVDDVVIYFFPIVMLVLAMSKKTFNTVDILQTVSIFSIMVIRHYILFKKEK